ncbi:MAG: Copper transport protein [Pseudonocardiales bacterium]|nr:Copper transport protein [Pseudonocardiales bacterium]
MADDARAATGRVSLRRAVRLALLAVGLAAITLLNPQSASAHAQLVRSDPSNGATVAQAPGSVRLWFSEAISPRLSSARLVDRTGGSVTGTSESVRGGQTLELRLPRIVNGTYGVLWRVLAEDDGHTTSGVVVFNVGAASGSSAIVAGGAAATSSPLDVTRRWIGIGLLAGLVGGLAVAGFVLGGVRAGSGGDSLDATVRLVRRRILTLASWCAGLAALAGVADLVAEARRVAAAGSSLGTAMSDLVWSTRWGHLWVVREAALLALVPVLRLALARVRTGGALGSRLAVGAAGLVAVRVAVEALGSHAAAVEPSRGFALAADAVHIGAACVWLGALPALALILGRPSAAGVGRADVVRACRRPFTVLVSISVGLVLLTGLYSAGREIESVDSLVSTGYGRALLVKIALLLVLSTLGLGNALRLHGDPRGDEHGDQRGVLRSVQRLLGAYRPTRRLVLAEAAAGAILLTAVAVLVESAPPRGPTTAPVSTEQQTRSGSVADLVVSVSATPNSPGVNAFTVVAASSRRPPPEPVTRLTLKVKQGTASIVVPLQQTAPGRYFGTARIPAAGSIGFDAVIQRGGQRLAVEIPWQVGEPGPARVVTARRLAPIVDGMALALLIGGGIAGAAWAWRRRSARRRPPDRPPSEPINRVLERQP